MSPAPTTTEFGCGLPLPRLYTCDCGATFRDRGYCDEVPGGGEAQRVPCPYCGGTSGTWSPPPLGDPRFAPEGAQ